MALNPRLDTRNYCSYSEIGGLGKNRTEWARGPKGVLVRRQKETIAAPDLRRDDIQLAGQELRRFAHSSRSRREIRSPRSVLSSYSKVRVGVRFSLIALAIFP